MKKNSNEQLKQHLLIVGAQKSGTSSLHNYLSQHPQIISAKNKELRFFTVSDIFDKGYDWYTSQFKRSLFQRLKAGINGDSLTYFIDSTPEYLYHHKTPELIKTTLNGNVKILILLRDPVQRAFSAYQMFNRFFKNPPKYDWVGRFNLISGTCKLRELLLDVQSFPTFAEVLNIEERWIQEGNTTIIEPSFIRRGFYANQISRYTSLFSKSQIKIIQQTALKDDTLQVIKDILKWLELDDGKVKNINLRKQFNKTKQRDFIKKDEISLLNSVYEQENLKLFELLGSKQDW